MTANLRYLNASFFSFCFHAAIFLYLYGTFNSNSSQNLLISKPLQVELKFESEIKSAKQETVNPKSLESRQMQQTSHPSSCIGIKRIKASHSRKYPLFQSIRLIRTRRKYHFVSGAGANIFL